MSDLIGYDVLNFYPNKTDVDEDIFLKRCLSAAEKYQMLEARDKILRARIPKGKVRVEFAKRLFGTCPDMCPEKERYMRQYQRQLTSLEMLPGQDYIVDHKRAIKVYSRSSADQEEPLPHELRPGSTLEMTMYYLLYNIVPLADNNEDILGDWYNFLWDRTRSIRKDITQQQLTNLCVVGLMEKCARLHIHCSSRLCELDVHLFEPKLNDENLMKCLQSLEHLYDDLRRRDIKCPNEPEFRAYQIMMNLNEGDILLAVQQRPEWILKSKEVQAAIKVHHYIFNQNFVAFFRLVKSFPYMFSCILHRYFYQVRFRALNALCRSGRKADVQLIYSQTQRMLGYSDEEISPEFEHFCESHGLIVDLENDRIFYRKRFLRPDSRIVSRETFLIDSKQTTSTAEAINGGPLPENPLLTYTPQSSFTEDGFLIPGFVVGSSSENIGLPFKQNIADLQTQVFTRGSGVTSGLFKAPMTDLERHNPPSYLPSSSFTDHSPSFNHAFKEVDLELFPPKPNLNIIERQLQERLRVKEDIRSKLVESFVDEVIDATLPNLVSSCAGNMMRRSYAIKRTQERHEREQKEEKIRNSVSLKFVETILEQSISALVTKIAQKEIKRHDAIRNVCESFAKDFIESNLKHFVIPVCRKAIHKEQIKEENRMKKLIVRLTIIFKRLKLRFILQKWQINAKLKRIARKQKEAKLLQEMLNFPAANPVGRSAKEILQQFRGNNRSPNIIKTSFCTTAFLDKYERAESIAESFKNNVSTFVFEMCKPHDIVLPEIQYPRTNLNEEFYRHCWKRRWSSSKDDTESPTKFKSPRLDDNINGSIRGTPLPLNCVPQTLYKKTDNEDLLQQIKIFAEDAQKEKEQLKKSEEVISEHLFWNSVHKS